MLRSALSRRVLPALTYREGTALVPASAAHEWPERMFLKRLLSRLQVDCVLDVGANLGQYAAELRMIGFRGLVISFEPTPSLHAQIAKWSKSHPKWVTMDVALGKESGTVPFNIMEVSALNSFHQPSTAETDSFAPVNSVVETVEVRVEALNELLPRLQDQYGFKRPFLKMDTQGHDIDVFDGASAVLDRLVGLQSEVSVKRIYEDTLHWTDAIAHYEKGGFDLAGLYKVNPGNAELVELDCFMVRR
jgi:FkbM family methyltransferase